MKILIADDNPSMRGLLGKLCASIATEVRECGNGAEAVRLFGDYRPEWTILDLVMPVMDGLAATRKIKAAFPAARIVIVTQQRGSDYSEAALHAGVAAFLLKDNLHSLPALLTSLSIQ